MLNIWFVVKIVGFKERMCCNRIFFFCSVCNFLMIIFLVCCLMVLLRFVLFGKHEKWLDAHRIGWNPDTNSFLCLLSFATVFSFLVFYSRCIRPHLCLLRVHPFTNFILTATVQVTVNNLCGNLRVHLTEACARVHKQLKTPKTDGVNLF